MEKLSPKTSFSRFILCVTVRRRVRKLSMEMDYTSSRPSFPPLFSFHLFPPEWTAGKRIHFVFFHLFSSRAVFCSSLRVTDNFRGISFYACNSGTQRLFPPRPFSLESQFGTARIKIKPSGRTVLHILQFPGSCFLLWFFMLLLELF